MQLHSYKFFSIACSILSTTALQHAQSDAPRTGFIDVSVATLWTDASKPRLVDQPALENPSRIQSWLDSMSVDQFKDLTSSSRTQTQALYGSRVHLLNATNGWYEIAVPGELTPKNDLGYPGWVPAAHVSFDDGYGEIQSRKSFAVVDKVSTTFLYRDSKLTEKFMEISLDTRLPVLRKGGRSIQVAVPSGGSAYISSRHATVFRSETDMPYPSQQDLVETAKLFLGRPYLWGGTSGYAVDCSGFTHTVYHVHGITLGRDASGQAMDSIDHGIPVRKSELQTGDLIFYADDVDDISSIYHVAMYVGNGKMMEAFDAGTPVRVTAARLDGDYWGARRFLKR